MDALFAAVALFLSDSHFKSEPEWRLNQFFIFYLFFIIYLERIWCIEISILATIYNLQSSGCLSCRITGLIIIRRFKRGRRSRVRIPVAPTIPLCGVCIFSAWFHPPTTRLEALSWLYRRENELCVCERERDLSIVYFLPYNHNQSESITHD